MSFDAHKNFAYSAVATAPSPATSGTSLVVGSGDGANFPAAPFNATVWPAGAQPTVANAEIVRVTAKSTDTFTITRAQEGTSARSIGVGDQIAATVTAKMITDIEAATGGSPAIVTTLPVSPSNGDECYLEVGSGDSAALWHLKYDSTIVDGYPWRFIGGASIHKKVDTGEGTSSGTFVDLTTAGPSVTIPYAGIYQVRLSAYIQLGGSGVGIASISTNGGTPSDNDGVANTGSGGDAVSGNTLEATIASITTSALIKMKYRSTGGTATFFRRNIEVTPVRLAAS